MESEALGPMVLFYNVWYQNPWYLTLDVEADQVEWPLNILESIPAKLRTSLSHVEIVNKHTALYCLIRLTRDWVSLMLKSPLTMQMSVILQIWMYSSLERLQNVQVLVILQTENTYTLGCFEENLKFRFVNSDAL